MAAGCLSGSGRDRLAAGSSARRAARVEMRNHFPGGPELFDHKEASRFLHQHALARMVHVARSDDKTNRDPANELVLVDRERNKLLTSGVRALTDKSDDLGIFAALCAPFVDLPAQSLIQRSLPLALFLFPVCSHRSSNSCVEAGEVRRVVATRSSRPHSRACADRRCYRKGYAPDRSGTSGCGGRQLVPVGTRSRAHRRGLGAARRGSTPHQRGGAIQRELKVGPECAFLAVLRRPSDPWMRAFDLAWAILLIYDNQSWLPPRPQE